MNDDELTAAKPLVSTLANNNKVLLGIEKCLKKLVENNCLNYFTRCAQLCSDIKDNVAMTSE